MTVGEVVFRSAPLTKVQTKSLASETSAALAAPVVIVAVNVVPAASAFVGVNIAVLPVGS